MSRVYTPVWVGNDFVITLSKKIPKTNQATIAVASLMPPPVVDVARPAPVLSQHPLQASSSPFLSAVSASPDSSWLSRPRIGLIVMAVALLCVITSGYAYRGRLMSVVSDIKYAARQLAQDVPKTKSVVQPSTDSQQITVSSSNVETDISGLIAQSINIKVGTQVINPTQASIMSWLNLARHGGRTVISVNGGELEAYLKQLVASNSHTATSRVVLNRGQGLPVVETAGQNGTSVQYSQSTYNQIANNLLKANGIDVNLAVVSTPYQTVVTSSQKTE